MRKSSFFIVCFFVLAFFDELGATLDLKLKFGIIVETCFNKTKAFEAKLSSVTKFNGSATVTVVDAPCGNMVAARKQVCSLIENDGVNLFVALATKPLLSFYEMAFNALIGPKLDNSVMETVISDIADEFEWNNIFIYVDTVYGDVMPRCSQRSMNTKSCQSVMIWTNEESPEAFINQTLFYKNGKKIVHMQTNHYVLSLSAKDTMEVIKIAEEKKLFNFRNEWLIFVGLGIDEVKNSLRCLKYNSNVYLAKIKSENGTQEIIRNILTIRNEWKNNYRSTYDIIRSDQIKHVCGNIKTDAGIKSEDIGNYSSVVEIFEVIPTRFEADPSLHLRGHWSMNDNPRFRNDNSRKIPNFEGVKLKVATLQTPPYVFVKKSNSSDHFSGYLVDMLDIAAERLNFTYDIFAVKDNEYGQNKCDDNGTCHWSGVIGAVQNGDADIALANLTPLADRAEAVMFLHAALETGGFRMIYSKPTIYDKSRNLRAYVQPFTYRSWICIIFTMLVMVFLLYVNQKWRNADRISKGFDINNPVFIAVQILCQQGLDDTPKDGSGRIVFIVMWLFSLLVFSSYAATLTSYFTTAELKLPIKNLDDFLKQTEYKLAFKTGSAYLTLMKSPNAPDEYRRLNERIQKDVKNSYVSSIEEGFERIRKEKLIFAHDRITLTWHESLSCNLIVVGPTYMKVGVTIATNHGSEYYRGLDWALRILNEGGLTRRSQKEHWGSKAECNLKNSQFQPVTMLTVITPFLILLAGLGGAILIAPFEGIYSWIQKAKFKPPPPTTNRKRHLVEASKKNFSNIRMFTQKNGLRRRMLSNRRSQRPMTLFF